MRLSNQADVANAPANDTVTTVDARSLEALYRAHSGRVLRRATALMRSRDAAQDVMQVMFLRALGARANLATPEARLRWLTRITNNVCLNWLRDSHRRSRILGRRNLARATAERLPQDRHPVPEDLLDAREQVI